MLSMHAASDCVGVVFLIVGDVSINVDDLSRQASSSYAGCLRTGTHRCNISLHAHWHSVIANSQWSFRFC